jgi:hypothetical protein
MQYTATQWNTAEDKEKFVKHFMQFVKKDFPQSMFNKKFYQRLSNTFGHIAHYDIGGFWDTFFTNTQGKVIFLQQTMDWPCYGEATYTFCDAEKEIQKQLKEMGVVEQYQNKEYSEINNKEHTEYLRLKNKFENNQV